MPESQPSMAAGGLLFAIVFLFGVFVYFAPSLTAHQRRHPQFTAILWLNILVGWTFIGWVAAFVWALTTSQVQVQRSVVEHAAPSGGFRLGAEKVCPRCAEMVKAAAQVCRYCGHVFSSPPPPLREAPELPSLDGATLSKATGPEVYKGFRYTLRRDFQVEVRVDGETHVWPSLFDFRKAVDALLQKPEA
jgi:hypothetical protein